MRKVLFVSLFLLVSSVSYAEQFKAFLKMTDGSLSTIVIDESSEIKIQGNLLKVLCAVSDEYNVQLLVNDVSSLSFDNGSTDVKETFEGTALCYHIDGEVLDIRGKDLGREVSVYDASGVLLQRVPVSGDACRVSLSSLPDGMILVTVNGKTIKLVKQ